MKDNKDDKIYNKVREIEFRAKTNGTDEWVYGDLVSHRNKSPKNGKFIGVIETTPTKHYGIYRVKTHTIGQFTGLCDKNGKKIYEGDVVKILYTDWASKSDNDTRTLEEYLDSLTKTGIVCWDNLSLCYHLKMKNGCYNSIHCGRYGYIEVVGNIYDNGGSDEECDN